MKFKWFLVAATIVCLTFSAANAQLIINEIDSDQTSTDTGEFIELYDGGTGNTPLDGYVVVLFNGSDDACTGDAFDLDTYSTDSNGYFVLGNAAVPNVSITFPSNTIQNGADAVALYTGDDTDWPNDQPVSTTDLIDAIVYDNGQGDDSGLLVLLNAGEPQVNENMYGQKDTQSIGRCPNGDGGARNTSTYDANTPSPGADNICTTAVPTPTTITAIQNGTGPVSGDLVEVDGIVTAFEDGNSAMYIQDGTGAYSGIAMYHSPGFTGFNVGDDVTVVGTIGAYHALDQIVVSDLSNITVNGTGTVPAAELLTTLATNDEQWEGVLVRVETVSCTDPSLGNGEWEIDDGSGATVVNDTFYAYTPTLAQTFDYVQGPLSDWDGTYRIEPRNSSDLDTGATPPTTLIINEVDADTANDTEFVELYDGGTGTSSLDGYCVVFYNGNGDVSYNAFDLDGYTTSSTGYFVIGNSAVTNVDLVFSNGGLQNGADAVALYQDDASNFPNGTAVTTTNLVDAVVYDTDDADDAELLVLLNASEPQVDEDANNNSDYESIGRCPNGTGGERNTSTYSAHSPTPGEENDCSVVTPVAVTINDIQYTTDPSGDSPYITQLVEFSGVITAYEEGENKMFVQDGAGAWNGVCVYEGFPGHPAGYAIGNNVTVVGTVAEYNGLTEITGVTITDNGAGTLPATTVISTLEANDEDYEGVLVEFGACTVGTVSGSSWSVDDGTGSVDAYSTYTITTPITAQALTYLIGVIDCFSNTQQILPRTDADIGTGTSPTPTPVTISDIQYTTDPSGDSPYVGDYVEFTGVVTAYEEGDGKMFVQDGAGAWNGVCIYENFPGHGAGYAIGNNVTVVGTVAEYGGLTEITNATVTDNGVGTLPAATAISTLAANEEQYEGVLVEFGACTVGTVAGGEWSVDDGTGTVNAFSRYNVITPETGEALTFLIGVMDCHSDVAQILPRTNADIGAAARPIPSTSTVGLTILLVIMGGWLGLTTMRKN